MPVSVLVDENIAGIDRCLGALVIGHPSQDRGISIDLHLRVIGVLFSPLAHTFRKLRRSEDTVRRPCGNRERQKRELEV